MNAKSDTYEDRPTLSLHRLQLMHWFNVKGGKERSAIEKPLDTPELIKSRLEWVRKWYDILTNPNEVVTYLDEKWFYTTNRRRKIKTLPPGVHEEVGDDEVPQPKIRSRRFPVKSMFLGVVGRPNEEHNFDGKILLKRVSEEVEMKQNSTNQNFTDDVLVNSDLKSGGWKEVIDDLNITPHDATDLIADAYGLEDAVRTRLIFQYSTFIGNSGNKKTVTIDDNVVMAGINFRTHPSKDSPPRAIEPNDLTLKVQMYAGDMVEKDCSCDSDFMLKVMDDVGTAIREKYHWVSNEKECYLVMDNAGGHGTKAAIDEYVSYLLNNYNIVVVFQIPRSPYCNALDLGVWCCLQAAVEKRHQGRRCAVKALVNSVCETWDSEDISQSITNVFGRLKKVLVLICEGNGSNKYVEAKRGKKFADMTLPPVPQQQAETVEELNAAVECDLYEEEDYTEIGAFY